VGNGGFATGAWAAAGIVTAAFYALFAHVRTVNERASDGVPAPSWTRYALPVSILVFLAVAVATAWLAPAWFGGVIIGGCIGVTVAFQVRRPRRPMPPPRRSSGPPPSDPPTD
jgi:small-conductance mechanosensitive channel